MTILDTRESPLAAPEADDDLEHVVCCIDDDTTLCGLVIVDSEIGDEDPTCVVCAALDAQIGFYADVYGEYPQGPGDPPCRVCPKRRTEAAR